MYRNCPYSDRYVYRSRMTLCSETVRDMYRSSLYRCTDVGTHDVPKWSCTDLALPPTDLQHNCNKTCKEMGGATSVMPVTDTTQWASTNIVCAQYYANEVSAILLQYFFQNQKNTWMRFCFVNTFSRTMISLDIVYNVQWNHCSRKRMKQSKNAESRFLDFERSIAEADLIQCIGLRHSWICSARKFCWLRRGST